MLLLRNVDTNQKQLQQVETAHTNFLRRLVRGGMNRKSSQKEINKAKKRALTGDVEDLNNIDWAWKFNNENILNLTKHQLCLIILRSRTRDGLRMYVVHPMKP